MRSPHWTARRRIAEHARMSRIGSYDALRGELAAERTSLVRHPLCAQLATLDDRRLLSEHHGFAVWDQIVESVEA